MTFTVLTDELSGTKLRLYLLSKVHINQNQLYIKISFIKNTIPSTVRMEHGAAMLPARAMWSGFCYSACLMAQVKS